MTTMAKKPLPRAEEGAGAKVVRSATVSIEVAFGAAKVFKAVSDPLLLPCWAGPVKAVRRRGGGLELDYETPERLITCAADLAVDERRGVVDWTFHLPQDPVKAYSRVIPLQESRSVLLLTLASPPMPERRADAGLIDAVKSLSQSMEALKSVLERSA